MSTQNPVKSTDTWEVKRLIKVPALANAADAKAVECAVSSLSGVRKVAVNLSKHQIEVRYDASQSAYQVIVEVLEGAGYPPLKNWWGLVKRNWYQFTDANIRDNAKAPPPSCCNKPPR